jgi:hypothetical protein
MRLTQSWLNYTKPGQFHHKHAHPNSFISGVLYMKAARQRDKIYFYKDGYKQISLPTICTTAKAGGLKSTQATCFSSRLASRTWLRPCRKMSGFRYHLILFRLGMWARKTALPHYIWRVDMAHFAELDGNNVVTRVIVVANKDTADANGNEVESIGVAFCQKLLGGNWKQTSYNGNIRKNYAGIGYVYDAAIDAFVPPKPYPSWVLNTNTAQWQAPIPMPTDGKMYSWDEATQSWVELPSAGSLTV